MGNNIQFVDTTTGQFTKMDRRCNGPFRRSLRLWLILFLHICCMYIFKEGSEFVPFGVKLPGT